MHSFTLFVFSELTDQWIVAILMNLLFFVSFIYRKSRRFNLMPWILFLSLCVFSFWNRDYFGLREEFLDPTKKGFRDFLYPYLVDFSFDSYSVFRFYIWGAAILAYYEVSKRFKINSNIAIYTLSIFFVLTFSYARASLGMAMFFWGFSYLIIDDQKLPVRLSKAVVLYGFAFMAHRSMAILIAISPVAMLLSLNKRNMMILVALLPVLGVVISKVLDYSSAGGDFGGEGMESFSKSAKSYSTLKNVVEMNWKFALVSNLRTYTIYAAAVLIAYYFLKKRINRLIPQEMKKLSIQAILIVFIAAIIAVVALDNQFGLNVVSYRILYMAGIPLSLLLAYSYQYNLIPPKVVNALLIATLIYDEGWILGKILSLGII